jgi:hypothetical protein
MTDNLSLVQAKKFVRLRWKMIWDNANWRQARIEHTATYPAGTETVTLPTGVEFVLAMRIAGDRELLPSQDLVQMMIDPAGRGKTGTTLAFSPMAKDSSGAARVRLHRALEQEQELFFICKAKCPELVADSDTPLIPGVDQCLIALALGDMYRGPQRSIPKAEHCYAEAQGHLNQMKDVEKVQTAEIVQLVPLVESGGYNGDWLVRK